MPWTVQTSFQESRIENVQSASESMTFNEYQKESKKSFYRIKKGRHDSSESVTIDYTPDEENDRIIGVKVFKQSDFKNKLSRKNMQNPQKNYFKGNDKILQIDHEDSNNI